jgi:hypothetical protein
MRTLGKRFTYYKAGEQQNWRIDFTRGFLVGPMSRGPDVFGASSFFKTFPYSLPSIIIAITFL